MNRPKLSSWGLALLSPTLLLLLVSAAWAGDPLPSWNEGKAKQELLRFAAAVSTPGSPQFVPAAERIAVFDNDGTLWAEQPAYAQLQFARDRLKTLTPQQQQQLNAAGATDEQALLALVMATHAGTSTEVFSQSVRCWIASARHPSTGRRYTEMTYQPMLELLALLRERGFKTYIVSGGGADFIRPWAEAVYGIPPEQVIGSRIEVRLEQTAAGPVLMRQPQLTFLNDKENKPVGIHEHIGRRPIAAFGNSDGDLAMLQWTSAGNRPHLAMLVHHTDAAREWAYDRRSAVGRLDQALAAAPSQGWIVADMQRDWATIYPPLQSTPPVRCNGGLKKGGAKLICGIGLDSSRHETPGKPDCSGSVPAIRIGWPLSRTNTSQ